MSSNWVVEAYNVVAWVGAFAAIAIAHLIRRDIINTIDAPPMQKVRIAIFWAIATALGASTMMEWSPLLLLAMVSIGVCALLHNLLALALRKPPHNHVGRPARAPSQPQRRSPPPLPRVAARR